MSQLALLDAAPVLRAVAAPPLWTPGGSYLLPDRVLCIALHPPYSSLLFPFVLLDGDAPVDGEVGPKSLETRGWPWPYEARWLAIYATLYPDRKAYRRIYGDGWKDVLAQDIARGEHGAILGLVWISGCRPMVPEDDKAAMFPFDSKLFVWGIGAAHRFPKPNTTHLARGPQKFIYIDRKVIVASLRGTAS
jgi:hypothetical protein